MNTQEFLSNSGGDSRDRIARLVSKKGKERISMLTCYDYTFARILDETGIDILLVGDSLANVVLGMERTKEISFREMFQHTKAVARACKNSLVIADMPYVCYQKNRRKALYFAQKFIEEAGADGVKIEWFKYCTEVVRTLIKHNIPVMGHIGLTPQTVGKRSKFRVQGKDSLSAFNLVDHAKVLEEIGIFSVVLECIPAQLAQLISAHLNIPTIGIGAGPSCDGQVLVLYDILGLYKKITPRFIKVYHDLGALIEGTVKSFISEVKEGRFPQEKHSFFMSEEELRQLEKKYKNFKF